MASSVELRNNLLNALLRTTNVEAGAYVSLHTGDPGTTGADEAAGGNYARVLTNQDAATTPYWNAAAGGSATNNGAITFPTGGDGDVVSHWGLWDTTSGGNFLTGGSLDGVYTYGTTVSISFGTGVLEVRIAV